MADGRDWAEPFRQTLMEAARQLAAGRTHGVPEAADVVQITLLEASLQAAPPAAAQLPWLKAALRNNFHDELRRLTAQKRNVRREHLIGSCEPAAQSASPSRRVRKAEEVQKLLKYLKALPSDQREAIQLRYIQELPVDRVAQQMRKTPAAAAGLLRRGLAALRREFESRK